MQVGVMRLDQCDWGGERRRDQCLFFSKVRKFDTEENDFKALTLCRVCLYTSVAL